MRDPLSYCGNCISFNRHVACYGQAASTDIAGCELPQRSQAEHLTAPGFHNAEEQIMSGGSAFPSFAPSLVTRPAVDDNLANLPTTGHMQSQHNEFKAQEAQRPDYDDRWRYLLPSGHNRLALKSVMHDSDLAAMQEGPQDDIFPGLASVGFVPFQLLATSLTRGLPLTSDIDQWTFLVTATHLPEPCVTAVCRTTGVLTEVGHGSRMARGEFLLGDSPSCQLLCGGVTVS